MYISSRNVEQLTSIPPVSRVDMRKFEVKTESQLTIFFAATHFFSWYKIKPRKDNIVFRIYA